MRGIGRPQAHECGLLMSIHMAVDPADVLASFRRYNAEVAEIQHERATESRMSGLRSRHDNKLTKTRAWRLPKTVGRSAVPRVGGPRMQRLLRVPVEGSRIEEPRPNT